MEISQFLYCIQWVRTSNDGENELFGSLNLHQLRPAIWQRIYPDNYQYSQTKEIPQRGPHLAVKSMSVPLCSLWPEPSRSESVDVADLNYTYTACKHSRIITGGALLFFVQIVMLNILFQKWIIGWSICARFLSCSTCDHSHNLTQGGTQQQTSHTCGL